ncbi:ABC transporter ATP-binding protein [Castellaniella caeni]|uniref:ABC transporter ATP-binding protein n=1 Tax=Castellaniella caeni TaxID=266123 RepID=UPI0008341825|nr:ABC transporter ATP-binding protein [Castellaniella caeni]
MLQIQDLSVAYGRRPIIHRLNAGPLAPGRVVSLLGPNGSGKSTLLKAIAGLLKCGGQVVLDGQDLTRQSFERRAQQVVYLPQSLPASVHLRVFESVLVAARASDLSPQAQAVSPERILDVLSRLGIEQLSMRYLDELSGGQKQLVGLAQALIRTPRLLLLDEPLSALDLNYQCHVMDLLRHETQAQGLTTMIVLHDLNMALQHSDDTLLIRAGELVGHGSPETVITTQSLAQVYQVNARVETCSRGLRHVLIDGLCTPAV